MVETVIAVLVVTTAFLFLFRLAHLLTGKILLEHAALRTARARSVGMNGWMCRKVATVAAIPALGRRIWPEEDMTAAQELARVPIYLGSPDGGVARGILEYEHGVTGVGGGHAPDPTDVRLGLRTDWFTLTGEAGVEENFSLYMNDEGR